MKRSSLLATIVGSALLVGGAMVTAPQVTANPSLLYLAGQAKMALGDTPGGLQLISRAAREKQNEQMPVPQAKPKQTVVQASKACSERTAVKAQEPTLAAKVEPKKLEKKTVTATALARTTDPKVLMAKMSIPIDPFGGHQDVPGMTREQVARVTAEYQRHIQQWTDEQTARQFELAKLERMTARTAELMKGRHVQFIKVAVPEPPSVTNFPPEPPRTEP